MNLEPFLLLRLIGTRFEGHSVPLAFLKDIAVLEEMVVEVAKSQFLADHPGRQRTPRGFTKDIHLTLTTIDSGSAVLGVRLSTASSELFPATNQRYFERARDGIMGSVQAATEGSPIAERGLSERMLSYFDRFGRSLRKDEAIEFARPDRTRTATLTRDSRRRLVLASPKVKELTEGVTIRGSVPEMNQYDMTFEVQLAGGRRIPAPIPAQHFDTILQAFSGYKAGMRVLFQGVGRVSRADQLLGFASIEHLSVIDNLDIGAQVDDLRLVEDGWLDGRGRAPSGIGLDWLLDIFDYHYPDEAPLPYLYPTETGGVQAEWSLGSCEVTLEVDLETHGAEWHVLDMQSGEVQERVLDCGNDGHWGWLVKQIAALNQGST